MRSRIRVLALTFLAGALVLAGGLALALQSGPVSVHAQGTPQPNPTSPANGPSSVPSARFFGNISVAGSAPSAGSTLVASIGGVTCGTAPLTGTTYSIDIQALPGCTTPNATVNFSVNGAAATQTGSLPAIPGTAVQLNLTVPAATPTPAPAAASTPPPPPPPPPTRSPAPPTPTVMRTATPTPVVPSRPPNTGLGGTQQQKPSGPAVAQQPAAPAAQRPAAAPSLPNTGTGGSASGTSPLGLVLAGLVTLAAAGASLRWLRRR